MSLVRIVTKLLDPETWRQVSPLLDRALELEGEARDAFLVGVRRDFPSQASMLEELLAEHRTLCREGFLDTPLASAVAALEHLEERRNGGAEEQGRPRG